MTLVAQKRAGKGKANSLTWPILPLGEVVDFNPRFGKDELAGDSLASFIPMKCVEEESGRFEPLGDRKVSEVSKGYTPFRDGDVIFAKVTPCMENGKAAVLKGLTNGVGFGSTEFFTLRPKNGLDANYLFHFILQSDFRRDAARNMTGAVGLRRVPKQWLEQQTIPLPDPKEQRRIVAEIEKQFTRLEAGVTALRRMQANLKRYRAAVLKATCEGRLVPTEAELHRQLKTENRKLETGAQLLQRILTERRQNWQGRGKYKEPAAPDIANLPEIPDGWTWATTAQLSFLDVGFAFKSAEFEKSGIRLLRGDNLEPGKMRWLDTRFWPESKLDEFRHLLIREGEIVLAMDRPLISSGLKIARARADDLPCLLVQRMARFRPVVEAMTSFLFMAMNTQGFIKHLLGGQTGTQLPHISGDGIQNFPVALPPLAEQTRIVAEMDRRLSVVEELESVVTANLQRASSLRQSILKKAFTGELA